MQEGGLSAWDATNLDVGIAVDVGCLKKNQPHLEERGVYPFMVGFVTAFLRIKRNQKPPNHMSRQKMGENGPLTEGSTETLSSHQPFPRAFRSALLRQAAETSWQLITGFRPALNGPETRGKEKAGPGGKGRICVQP